MRKKKEEKTVLSFVRFYVSSSHEFLYYFSFSRHLHNNISKSTPLPFQWNSPLSKKEKEEESMHVIHTHGVGNNPMFRNDIYIYNDEGLFFCECCLLLRYDANEKEHVDHVCCLLLQKNKMNELGTNDVHERIIKSFEIILVIVGIIYHGRKHSVYRQSCRNKILKKRNVIQLLHWKADRPTLPTTKKARGSCDQYTSIYINIYCLDVNYYSTCLLCSVFVS
jgi:hypothetical protein